eukprot:PhF_6_TR17376/c0_g1_i1/m.26608/K07921/RAB34; Ras-related protein Rab-34
MWVPPAPNAKVVTPPPPPQVHDGPQASNASGLNGGRIPVDDYVIFRRDPLSGTTPFPDRTKFSDDVASIASLLEEPVKTKVVVVGDAAVGKTSALTVLQTSSFTSGYKATVGVDFFYVNYNVMGVLEDVVFWDTAGQEQFRSIAGSYYKGASCVLLFFAVDNRPSFDHILTIWISDVKHYAPEKCRLFLVATKCDLMRVVTRQEAHDVAVMLGAEYWEISSKTDHIPDRKRNTIRDLSTRIAVVGLEMNAYEEYKIQQMRKGNDPTAPPVGLGKRPQKPSPKLDRCSKC